MAENAFVLPAESYKRDLRLVQNYMQDAAVYLSKMTGRPLQECTEFVKRRTARHSGTPHAFKDPVCTYLERSDKGDRELKEGPFSQFLGEAIRDRELIAAPFTTYYHPEVKKSLLVDFVDLNVKARSKAKKEMFQAEKDGDNVKRVFKKIEQTGRKLSNNAISGAHVSDSTPLFNKTAHATLTSTCRETSGFGNANNEKFLCGNRHYWSPEIVTNNIVSIINHTDYAKIEEAMQLFGIRAPTVDEALQCITYSTDLYWRDIYAHESYRRLLTALSPLERAAFVYTSDLYHLRQFNEEVVRTFIGRLSTRIVPSEVLISNLPEDEVMMAVHAFPEDQITLAFQICSSETKGMKLEKLVGKPALDIVYATLLNIRQVIHDYYKLIRAFWVTDNVPASLAVFPDSIRRSAITSDTDSTIFTVQEWVHWHEGRMSMSQEAQAIGATLVFLAAQTITHVLARMSANFGIVTERIFQVAMKNEYYFPVFVPTQVAKHYYALISVQEGFLKPEFEYEIKGVHLKSSKAPKVVTAEAKKMMVYILETTYAEQPISIRKILKWIARIEHSVMDAIRKGSYEYFQKSQIKQPDSYKNGGDAPPYQQYQLWQAVFAPKYGEINEPPYTSIKVSVDLDSSMKTKEWLAGLEDRQFATRCEAWMTSMGKKHMGTSILLPEPIISSKGLPDEILQAIGMRKMVMETTRVFYLILESLGEYMVNKKITRLVSDHISKEVANS